MIKRLIRQRWFWGAVTLGAVVTLLTVFLRLKKLPEAVTREWYTGTMRQLVLTLQNKTNARIALCSIPPLGEDLDSLPNQRVRQFNQDVKALADELDVAYLPVYEIMEQYLRAHQQEPGQAFDESSAETMMMRAFRDHNIRGHSWEDISAHHGLLLQTDTIHFNSHGANIIADLIEGWLHTPVA